MSSCSSLFILQIRCVHGRQRAIKDERERSLRVDVYVVRDAIDSSDDEALMIIDIDKATRYNADFIRKDPQGGGGSRR